MRVYNTTTMHRGKKEHTKKYKVLVVVGPTASGKTCLAIAIAKEFGGEIISADSRQVYRGLDIGTEKISHEEIEDVPHHLIDIADPQDIYTAADFVRDATAAIDTMSSRKKLPIIAGGTLFYVDALLGKRSIIDVEPDHAYRTELERKDTKELFALLEKQDPHRSLSIDRHNKRRLIRALEIVNVLGIVPSPQETSNYDSLIIGIHTDPEELRDRIRTRLTKTLEKGLVEETQKLLAQGLTRERLHEIGLEYRIVLQYLDGTIDYDTMKTKLEHTVWQYAKRQMTWLKRDESIVWYTRDEFPNIAAHVAQFLNS